jgi:hypothetical protein
MGQEMISIVTLRHQIEKCQRDTMHRLISEDVKSSLKERLARQIRVKAEMDKFIDGFNTRSW